MFASCNKRSIFGVTRILRERLGIQVPTKIPGCSSAKESDVNLQEVLDLPCPEKGGFWHSIRQCTLHLKISLKSIAGLSLDCFEIQVNKKTVCCCLFVFGPHSLSWCFECSSSGTCGCPWWERSWLLPQGWGGRGEGLVQCSPLQQPLQRA